MPNQTPNFALPGLMTISRPELERQRDILRLYPQRVQDATWPGLPSVGPIRPGGVAPTYPLALVEVVFGDSRPVGNVPRYTLSSAPSAGQGTVVIDNPATWLLHVPVQPLPLPLGLYYWELRTTDSQGVAITFYVGTQLVTE